MKNLKKNLETIEKFEAINQEELNLIKGGTEMTAADSTKNDSTSQDSKKHDTFGHP